MRTTLYRVNAAGEATRRNGRLYYPPDPHDYWPSVNTRTARYHLRRRWRRKMRARIARSKMREG